MIRDIPTQEDFREQGLTLLNLAWDTVVELLLNYRDAKEWDAIVDEEQTDHYLKASQKPLAIATALLQQGTEFLVKAAIAEVSPFLLIVGNPQSWPKKCDTNDASFSAFRTADAEDLIRIHDTVANTRFTEEFTRQFSEMRRVRNTVFHSVDRNLRFSEKDILLSILTVTSELHGPNNGWMIVKNIWNQPRLRLLQPRGMVQTWCVSFSYLLTYSGTLISSITLALTRSSVDISALNAGCPAESFIQTLSLELPTLFRIRRPRRASTALCVAKQFRCCVSRAVTQLALAM